MSIAPEYRLERRQNREALKRFSELLVQIDTTAAGGNDEELYKSRINRPKMESCRKCIYGDYMPDDFAGIILTAHDSCDFC